MAIKLFHQDSKLRVSRLILALLYKLIVTINTGIRLETWLRSICFRTHYIRNLYSSRTLYDKTVKDLEVFHLDNQSRNLQNLVLHEIR